MWIRSSECPAPGMFHLSLTDVLAVCLLQQLAIYGARITRGRLRDLWVLRLGF